MNARTDMAKFNEAYRKAVEAGAKKASTPEMRIIERDDRPGEAEIQFKHGFLIEEQDA